MKTNAKRWEKKDPTPAHKVSGSWGRPASAAAERMAFSHSKGARVCKCPAMVASIPAEPIRAKILKKSVVFAERPAIINFIN